MKIGIAGYPVPPGVDRSTALEWTIREAKRLGVDDVGGDPRALLDPATRHDDADQLRRLHDLADSTGVEIEPYVRGPFDLVGPDAAAARAATIERALAHLAVTTHLKDMRVVQHGDPGQVPFLPVGCALGEGLVDVPGTIRTLVADAPRGRQTPLIVETGWPPAAAPGEDGPEARRRMFAESIAYLRRLLPELGLA